MKRIKKLIKIRTRKTKKIIVPTIDFKDSLEDSELVQTYKNFKLEDHIPLEKNEAKIDELRNEGLPKSSKAGIRDEKLGTTMNEGRDAFCGKALVPIENMKKEAEKAKDDFSEMYQPILEKAQQIDQDAHLKKTDVENKALLDNVQTPIKNEIRELESNIEQHTKVIMDTNITLSSDENEYPEKKPFINTKTALVLFCVILIVPDFSITYQTLQAIVDEGNNFQLLVMTTGIGYAFFWLSHLIGKFAYKNDRRKLVLFGLLGIFLLVFMSIVRIVTGANLVFTVLYIILFALGSAFAYLREEKQPHYDTVDSNKEAINKRNEELGKKDILVGHVGANNKAFDVACEQNKKSAEKHSSLIEDNGKAIEKKFDKFINSYADYISMLRTDLEEGYVRGYKIAEQSNPTATNLNGAIKNGVKALSVLLIACLSFTTSCTPAETAATGVVIDVTIERPLENHEGEIEAIQKINAQVGPNSARHFYITTISNRSFDKISSPEPLPKSWYWSRNEIKRTEEINIYEGSCDSLLLIAFESMDGSGRKSTYILRNIKWISTRMSETKAHRKRLILYSDMLSHNKAVSFYDYRDELEEIENKREEIADKLNKDSPTDLNGYDLIVVHQPSAQNDELIRKVWEFWEWYFLQHCNAKSIRFEQSLI